MTSIGTAGKAGTPASIACGAAGWLGLAASPTFTLMAWISAADSHQAMMCAPASDLMPFSEMTLMYLLMGLFHLSPWLRLASGIRHPLNRRSPSGTQGD
ncbi:hypothetical protein HDIA_3201 [Hartmannibacter diazotrophicus]|uniref:Uncharacterized protein n=1 Tax=Hartmannibacter diazotrophicus TaxID=1482074 RepID=A0A2C9D8V2_9HYPH|nr:hypothetical protein [Hartmannibacter diazotrophicus]SON56742.1 hypothetical protein HDIA_3201 [Hartmannibacter diazotrophicus]